MPRRPLVLAALTLSGAACLVSQIVWQRLLALVSGSDTLSATIIVSAFLAGLGAGHLAGGSLADRLSTRAARLAVACCEVAIALFAAGSTFLFYDLLYVRFASVTLSPAMSAALMFAAMLWPTFMMGLTLPLATVGFGRDAHRGMSAAPPVGPAVTPAAHVAASLYGWNAVGAAAGALFTVALLTTAADLELTLVIGASLNLCGAVAVLLADQAYPRAPERHASPVVVAAATGTVQPWLAGPRWLVVYALSGFIALSLELAWFRVLGVVLKSHSLTFGWLLAFYIGGLGLGSLLGRGLLRRTARPAGAFLAAQLAIPVCSAVAVAMLAGGLAHLPWLEPMRTYLAAGEPHLVRSGIRLWLVLYIGVPLGLLGLPSVLMGTSFTLLQGAVQRDPETVGRRLGWLQAANIAGSVGGALLTGLVLLDTIGVAGVFRVLVGVGVLVVLTGWRLAESRGPFQRVAVPGLVAACAAAWLVPSGAAIWTALHGVTDGRPVIEERASGVSLLRSDSTWLGEVFANGLSQSVFPYGGTHTLLGLLPALLHEAPRRIAVIGLGSGDTLFAVGARGETEQVESVEIMAGQRAALRRFSEAVPYDALRRLLRDPRIRHTVTDGRAFLARTESRFDIIAADALRPDGPNAGALYSVEYFELLRQRLNPGGFAATWLPTPRALATLLRVFPYVLVVEDVGIASDQPFAADRALLREGLSRSDVRRHFEGSGVDLDSVLANGEQGRWLLFDPAFDRSALTELNHDLVPRDEFGIAQSALPGLPPVGSDAR